MAADEATKKTISVRVEEEFHRDLRVYAAETGDSVGEICRKVIEAWWAKQPEKELYAKRRAEEGKKGRKSS